MSKTSPESENCGQFFVVATPIGNLEDMSPRGVRILKTAQIILSEDTRMTEQLLNHLGIRAEQKLIRFDQHKEHEDSSFLFMVEKIKEQLSAGLNIALVSDAGTPGISDPGGRLLATLHDEEIKVTPIPGASAITTFISAVGVTSNSFTFNGFLPKDEKKKEKLFSELSEQWSEGDGVKNRKEFFKNLPSQFFFESPERMESTIKVLSLIFLNKKHRVSIGKELTKKFERMMSGEMNTISAKWHALSENERKGEWVLLLENHKDVSSMSESNETLESPNYLEALRCLQVAGVSLSDSVKSVCHVFGANRNEVYKTGIKLFNTD